MGCKEKMCQEDAYVRVYFICRIEFNSILNFEMERLKCCCCCSSTVAGWDLLVEKAYTRPVKRYSPLEDGNEVHFIIVWVTELKLIWGSECSSRERMRKKEERGQANKQLQRQSSLDKKWERKKRLLSLFSSPASSADDADALFEVSERPLVAGGKSWLWLSN